MGYIPIKGITISVNPYKEKDRVIVLFSDEIGKIRALMRSVRNINSKRSGLSDEFLYEKMLVYQKGDRFTVTDVDLLDAFVEARNNIENYKVFLYIKELVILLLPYEQPDHRIFNLILETLYTLNTTKNASALLISFILHLLEYAGIPIKLPDNRSSNYYFLPEMGGFNENRGMPVDKNIINEVALLYRISVKEAIPVHNEETILKLLNDFILYHTDSLHFKKFLETIEKFANI